MKPDSKIQSVARAFTIVDILAEAQDGLALNEIASRMSLPKSTVHGLISTLKDFSYVEQSVFTGKYKLGVRFFEVGNIVAQGWEVRTVAAPYISQLLEELGETVHLVVLDKMEVLYIDKRESRHSLRIVSQIGTRLPAHCTGVGKVLMAHLTPEQRAELISKKGLPRLTRNTLTDPEPLKEELAQVKRQGYAIDNEEIMDSLRCVAAPIRDQSGNVISAISLSGPVGRLNGKSLEKAIKRVKETAEEISARLGYRSKSVDGEDSPLH